MILYEPKKLIFSHAPHCGGTFVSSVLASLGGEPLTPDVGQHSPTWLLTDKAREEYTVVGIHRDPEGWYRGCYQFAHDLITGTRNWKDHGFWNLEPFRVRMSMIAYGNGRMNRKSVIYGLTHMGEVQIPPAQIGIAWGYAYPNVAFHVPGGLWTWAMHWFYGGIELKGRQTHPPDVFLRQSHLAEDLAELLDRPVEEIAALPKVNTAPRAHEPLDADERLWIKEADGEFAKSWGYYGGS